MDRSSQVLGPYAEEFLKAEEQQGGRLTLSGDVLDLRKQFMSIWDGLAPLLPGPPPDLKMEEATLPSGRRIKIYIPKEAAEQGQKLPIGLYIHCGGWFAGSIEMEDNLCYQIAPRTPVILFSPDYRLAPEDEFPKGLDDCVEAYKWMLDNAAKYGGDNSHRLMMGGSAGGNLTAATTLRIIDEADDNMPKPTGIIVAVPVVLHPDTVPEEYKSWLHLDNYLGTPMVDRPTVTTACAAYGSTPSEPYHYVLLHPKLDQLPPTYLVACTHDPTYEDTVIFNDALKKRGVDVSMRVFEGYPHFFWLQPWLKMSGECIDIWVEKLQGFIGKK